MMEETGGGGIGADTHDLEKAWRNSFPEINELAQRLIEFARKVDSGLHQPYFFADAKSDFEILIAQLDAIEKSLKPKTVKFISKSDITENRDRLGRERQQKERMIEAETQKIEAGTGEALRVFLREKGEGRLGGSAPMMKN